MESPATPIVVVAVDGVIHVGGEFDRMTAPQLDACSGTVDGGVLDMTGVTFVDSVGLSVLITHHLRQLREGAALRIIAMSQPVGRLLEITGLLTTLTEGSALPA